MQKGMVSLQYIFDRIASTTKQNRGYGLTTLKSTHWPHRCFGRHLTLRVKSNDSVRHWIAIAPAYCGLNRFASQSLKWLRSCAGWALCSPTGDTIA